MKNYFVLITFCFCSALGHSQILFEEVSESVNFNFSNEIIYGTGVSFCDFDNDGWDDITAPSDEGETIGFFKNMGGTFEEVFFEFEQPIVPIKQVVWVDYDNDGDKDMYVVSEVDKNKLFQNNDFVFTDVTISSGLPDTKLRTNSCSWGDYDNDGHLDLFLGNRDLNEIIPNMIFRNKGDGTFEEANASSGIGDLSVLTFQGTFFDFDNDGWLDIYLINDRLITSNILYKNNGDGTFTDVSQSSTSDYVMNAMSVGIDDYNADGYIDVYVTNTYNPDLPVVGNALMKNNGDGTFSEIAAVSGVGYNSTSWGANFLDADNNGRLDLYVSGSNDNNNGDNVSAAFYYQNEDESFTRILDNGFENDLAHSFGNAIGDYNNDGYVDIAVSNNEPYTFDLWNNKSHEVNSNNWLKISLEGIESNRDGYGSRIEISIDGIKQYRVTASVESYLSQNSDTEIFGIGDAETIDYIKVTWLSGQVDILEDVEANQTLSIVEGQSPLSLDEVQEQFDIELFPNPANDYVTVRTPSVTEGEYEIRLYTLLGQRIATYQAQSKEVLIPVSDLKGGTYFLTYYKNNERVLTKKIVKL